MKHKQLCKTLASFLSLLCILPAILSGPAFAQSQDAGFQKIEIPSSMNPVGSGARALGMGSAFIAVADDATAASWNPGGLVQLGRPEISLVAEFFHRTEDNTFGSNSEASGDQTVNENKINYFSLAYPFTLLNRNMIVSLNYQPLYDFTREWDFPLLERSDRTSTIWDFSYQQEGGLYAVGLAYAIQITPKFSFGITLNFWEDWLGDNGWDQNRTQKGEGIDHLENTQFSYDYQSWNQFSFSGFNANLGFLWNVTDKLTLGVVLKTPFTAGLRHESKSRLSSDSDDLGEWVSASEDEELDMPMSYGVGLAYRFSDHLTVSADLYRTEWQDFVLRDSEGRETCPVSGLVLEESDMKATHQVRIGGEYLFFDPKNPKYVIPVRCGVFYDPSPAEGSPDDLYGFSLGSGIVVGRFVFDVAYQYRFGSNVGTSVLRHLEFSQDVSEHTLYSSVIVHF